MDGENYALKNGWPFSRTTTLCDNGPPHDTLLRRPWHRRMGVTVSQMESRHSLLCNSKRETILIRSNIRLHVHRLLRRLIRGSNVWYYYMLASVASAVIPNHIIIIIIGNAAAAADGPPAGALPGVGDRVPSAVGGKVAPGGKVPLALVGPVVGLAVMTTLGSNVKDMASVNPVAKELWPRTPPIEFVMA
jgi:hypothetical protein